MGRCVVPIVSVLFVAASWQSTSSEELWLNTTYQAEDYGIDVGNLAQCRAWQLWWQLQTKLIDLSPHEVDLIAGRLKTVSLKTVEELSRYGLPESFLNVNKVIHINFENVCKRYSRILWINSTSLARRNKVNLTMICTPYRNKLEPNAEDVRNMVTRSLNKHLDHCVKEGEEKNRKRRQVSSRRRSEVDEQKALPSVSLLSVFNAQDNIRRTDSVLLLEKGKVVENATTKTEYQVDLDNNKEELSVIIWNERISDFLNLNASKRIFELHEGLGILLNEVCKDTVPDFSDESTASSSPYEDTLNDNLGIDFEAIGMNVQSLAETFRNDSKLNNIIEIFDSIVVSEERPLSSTLLLPVFEKTKYDHRTPPILFAGQKVDVRVGIHVQSMSNFELTTMDYDMDVWLRMAWRDPRLAHGFDHPILVNDEMFLKKIWRPDPFFVNAKYAHFHRVTFPNFYMLIFADGEIFFEIRLYLKPSCQLVLCKYPHDSQVCALKISSIAFTNDVVMFHWFPKKKDAVRMNRNVHLPELYIFDYSRQYCDGTRKSGNYSCLEARFYMARNIGYHMAQTYVPTAMCVIFSWISVWLPEEFIDGRVFVSLTVFLTLSAEGSSAKEILPKVSYTKAIDIWFGFTAIFVFGTMLQAMIVISLEHKSGKLRKEAEDEIDYIDHYKMMKIMLRSRRYHKVARSLDTYCKTLYPVIFTLFLIIYAFVITKGEETKCLRQ